MKSVLLLKYTLTSPFFSNKSHGLQKKTFIEENSLFFCRLCKDF